MLDLLRQAEPQGRLMCLQCLQNQRFFHSIQAEQNSVFIRQGCCKPSRKGLVLVSQGKVRPGRSQLLGCCRESAAFISLLRASSSTELFLGQGCYWRHRLSGTACLSAGGVLLGTATVLGTATQCPLGAHWLLASLHLKAQLPVCILTRFTHSRFLGQARTLIPCCIQQLCMEAARK